MHLLGGTCVHPHDPGWQRLPQPRGGSAQHSPWHSQHTFDRDEDEAEQRCLPQVVHLSEAHAVGHEDEAADGQSHHVARTLQQGRSLIWLRDYTGPVSSATVHLGIIPEKLLIHALICETCSRLAHRLDQLLHGRQQTKRPSTGGHFTLAVNSACLGTMRTIETGCRW